MELEIVRMTYSLTPKLEALGITWADVHAAFDQYKPTMEDRARGLEKGAIGNDLLASTLRMKGQVSNGALAQYASTVSFSTMCVFFESMMIAIQNARQANFKSTIVPAVPAHIKRGGKTYADRVANNKAYQDKLRKSYADGNTVLRSDDENNDPFNVVMKSSGGGGGKGGYWISRSFDKNKGTTLDSIFGTGIADGHEGTLLLTSGYISITNVNRVVHLFATTIVSSPEGDTRLYERRYLRRRKATITVVTMINPEFRRGYKKYCHDNAYRNYANSTNIRKNITEAYQIEAPRMDEATDNEGTVSNSVTQSPNAAMNPAQAPAPVPMPV